MHLKNLQSSCVWYLKLQTYLAYFTLNTIRYKYLMPLWCWTNFKSVYILHFAFWLTLKSASLGLIVVHQGFNLTEFTWVGGKTVFEAHSIFTIFIRLCLGIHRFFYRASLSRISIFLFFYFLFRNNGIVHAKMKILS